MAALTGVSSLTTAGLFLWVVYGTPLLFEVSILGQFLLFLDRALGPQTFDDAKRISWPLTPFWSFQLLVGIFVAELFLGALLDVQIYGGQFLAQFPFVPLSGSNGFLVGLNAIYDGLWFIAGVCVSAWFLIVMGAEMGSLVIFKIRESHEREQKVRLGLMLTVYAVAVVYIPSFWSKTPLISSPALSSIPVIGWGMGIRTGGPFAPTFFSAIILMYVSVGVLTVLFGRRALCSVMCGAAMMYQATTISAMKTYNRTSRIGRMFLGSRFSTMYTIASSLALISLLGTLVPTLPPPSPRRRVLGQRLRRADAPVRALFRRTLVPHVRLDPVHRELQLRHDGVLPLGIVQLAVREDRFLQAQGPGQDHLSAVHDHGLCEGVPHRARRYAAALPHERGVP